MFRPISKFEVATGLAKIWGIYKQRITKSDYEYLNLRRDNTGLIDYMIENGIISM
jgi:hypothetical protein